MLISSDRFSLIPTKNTYFAGANTPNGFIGEYENFLSEDTFEKIFIIKGGSGTGKSTMIRKAAESAVCEGALAEYFLCSSDPESLDGVILSKGDKKIGIVDGTAPHTLDPLYPGACGEIINCGDYWDEACLRNGKEAIAVSVKRKREAYKRAYRFLGAAGEIAKMQRTFAKELFDKEKAKKAVERLLGSVKPKGGRGNIISRRTLCISMKGQFRLTSFESAESLVAVADRTDTAQLFYELVLEGLLLRGYDTVVSYSPFSEISELFVPSLSLAFVPQREGIEYSRSINLQRFINKEEKEKTKQRRTFLSKCMTAMTEGALESLFEAGREHFVLEDIYKEAMDFPSLEGAVKELSKTVIKRLM